MESTAGYLPVDAAATEMSSVVALNRPPAPNVGDEYGVANFKHEKSWLDVNDGSPHSRGVSPYHQDSLLSKRSMDEDDDTDFLNFSYRNTSTLAELNMEISRTLPSSGRVSPMERS